MQGQIKKPLEDCVDVRPHHGLCAEFFRGEGYSGEFVENMSAVLSELNSSDPLIRLTVGADRICCRCPNNSGEAPAGISTPTLNEYKGFSTFSPLKGAAGKLGSICESAEKVTRYDNAVLDLCGLSEGSVLHWSELRALVQEKIISPGLLSQVCGDCIWFGICGLSAV